MPKQLKTMRGAVNPTAYMDEIVIPSVKAFMFERGNRRHAYPACIVAFHLSDYVYRHDGTALADVRKNLRTRCPASFDVIEGLCNGSKHAGRNRGSFRHTPGTERDVPAFAFDTPGAGWDEGRWSVQGLEVAHDGQQFFVDWCLQAFITKAVEAYPVHFGSTDLSWRDLAFTQ